MKSFQEHLKAVLLANEDAFIRVDQKKKTIFASSNINTRRLNMIKERHPDFKVQFIYKEEEWNAICEGKMSIEDFSQTPEQWAEKDKEILKGKSRAQIETIWKERVPVTNFKDDDDNVSEKAWNRHSKKVSKIVFEYLNKK